MKVVAPSGAHRTPVQCPGSSGSPTSRWTLRFRTPECTSDSVQLMVTKEAAWMSSATGLVMVSVGGVSSTMSVPLVEVLFEAPAVSVCVQR